jgi:hypothetical protein
MSRNHWDLLDGFVDLTDTLVERWESGNIAEIVNDMKGLADEARAYMADDPEIKCAGCGIPIPDPTERHGTEPDLCDGCYQKNVMPIGWKPATKEEQ